MNARSAQLTRILISAGIRGVTAVGKRYQQPAHDPFTYAVRSAGYIDMMKLADPTIKIGVVAVLGEEGSVNNFDHPIVNPSTGGIHYGEQPAMWPEATKFSRLFNVVFRGT